MKKNRRYFLKLTGLSGISLFGGMIPGYVAGKRKEEYGSLKEELSDEVKSLASKGNSSDPTAIGNSSKAFMAYGNVLPRPSWISRYPIVMVGNWDDMPIFRRRVGGNPVWQEDEYYQENTIETVKNLKDLGVTIAVIHFYKGFGLEAEKEHISDSKKLALMCKKNGLKVGVYVGFDLAYETFLSEKPEAKEWLVPDYMGQPLAFFKQTFRKRVYFMHPGFIQYMKRVVRIAIEDLKVDLIHFDNAGEQALPPIFFHPMAIENFRIFLKNKYSPEMLKKRFGFSDVSYMEPPKLNLPVTGFDTNPPLSKIDDPLFQEWADFRCQELADYYSIMGSYIRGLNKEVAIDINPGAFYGVNTTWVRGVDYSRLCPHTDFMWTEEGGNTGVNSEGILISKIRSYKLAQIVNNRIFTYTRNKLEMAESMTYNRQGLGMIDGFSKSDVLPEDEKKYIKFFHNNFEYYSDIINLADVAVLHSFATMAYNNDLPYQSTYLFEQTLIQAKIPFDIVLDDNLKDLSKYKVLVLADQECLNDEKLDLIRNFVRQGGGLVATEHTSLYTEWRNRKRDFGLKDLLKVEAPEWRGSRSPESLLDIPVKRNNIGKGRVVYIPKIEASIPKPPTVDMTNRYWKLPVNRKDLIESVKWASGNSLSVNIEAPITVTTELTQKEDKSALMLHLVNYDFKKAPVQNIEVSVQVLEGKKIKQVIVKTPDGRDDNKLQFKIDGKKVLFTVPILSTYDVVIMKLE